MFDSHVRRALYNTTSARALAIALGLSFAAGSAHAGGALPSSGAYVAGSGTIAKSGKSGLTIDQSSATGIIDWNSFSIGRKNSVSFDNGSGATLNRVTGGNLSTIAGSLKATGSLYLINPQGMIVSGTGRVLTGGNFVGSSRDLSDDDFSHGKRRFTGTSKGAVVNQGTIRSANGDVALIGSSASNSGTISASHGSASLDAGDNILLAPAGSNSHILVSGGSGNVTNSGTIAAAQVQLNAAGGNVYALSGNNGGIVRATGTSTIGGHVWLTSNSGNVNIGGTVAATNANGSGGVVTARAGNIAISGNINTSATKAAMTGGTVSMVARNSTDVSGRIAAQGGDHGTGGFVETSGQHVHVEGSARITTLAKDGIAGDWLIDPNDFTIAASGGDITGATLSSELASGDVTIKSSQGATAGNGDIFVDANVSWSTTKTLTLDAYRNIDINAAIKISGGGGLNLIYGDQAQTGTGNAADGDLLFSGGNVAFTEVSGVHTKGSLTINGTSFTLLHTITELAASIATTPNGNYALAVSYNASGDGTYTASPIPTTFTGTLEGLGNAISNLTINSTTIGQDVGFFTQIGDGAGNGVARDLSLTDVSETVSNADDYYYGLLAGAVDVAKIQNVFVSGSLTIDNNLNDNFAAGLVGDNGGTISNATANVTVSSTGGGGTVAGLVGMNAASGTITHSSANATLIIPDLGGESGGLVAENSGVISESYSTGTGAETEDGAAGGLVAINETGGQIEQSYSTASVDSDEQGGGLVGYNKSGASISNSYAMGLVFADGHSGGLVSENAGTISDSYATGLINDPDDSNGGLVAKVDSGSVVTDSYWNSETSGYATSAAGTGKTTTQLQGTLPAGFDSSIWGTGTGLYPYLKSLFPTPPQYVSGTIYQGAPGTTEHVGYGDATVSVLVNGNALLNLTTGANGYFYSFVNAGTFSGTQQILLYLNNDPYNNSANTLVADPMTSIDADLYFGYVRLLSNASTFSTMLSQLETAQGSNSGDNFLYSNGAFTSSVAGVDVESDAGGLNINENIDLASSGEEPKVILNVAGDIYETDNSTISAYSLTGSSYGTVTLDDSNAISILSGFDTGRDAPFSLVNSTDLTVNGKIDTRTQSITLKALHPGHDIVVDSLFSGGTVGLYAGGTISEGASGSIDATKLTGSAEGAVNLGKGNEITSLGDFTVTGAGGFALTNDRALDVTGAVSADDSSTIALSTKSGNLTLSGSLDASTVTLVTAGEATQSSASGITAGTLNVTAQTGIDLPSSHNDIKKIGTRKTKSGPNVIKT